MTMEQNLPADDILNTVEMLDELNFVDTSFNGILFGVHSQLRRNVKTPVYLNNTITSSDQIEVSSIFSSKDFSGPNNSENFDLVVNEPIRTAIDMDSDMYQQTGSLNDGPCESSLGIPGNSLQTHLEEPVHESVTSFYNGQSTDSNSNGLIYQLLTTAVRI